MLHRNIIERVFYEMKACGQPEAYALEAALTVFNYYNPFISSDTAKATVERWTVGKTLH